MILSPIGNSQVYNVDGTLIVGGKIWSYVAETTTLAITYSDRNGTIQHTNPIILNQYGLPNEPIWIQEGRKYKFVFMDEDDNLLWTYDNISGINDFTVGGGGGEEEEINSEWILGDIGVYQSANSFYINGDRSSVYHKFRRIKLQMAINFVYGFISDVSYNSDLDRTEIGVVLDSGAINEFLSNTYYSILSYAPQSYPNFLPMAQWQKRGNDLTIASGSINVWEHSGNFAHVIGTGDIINMGTSLQEGATKYLLFDDIDVTIFNTEKIKTPQGVNLNVIRGDILEVFAGADGVNLVTRLMSNEPTEVATWDSPLQTRQTVLVGPTVIQIPNITNIPYYSVPPVAMTDYTSNGYTCAQESSAGTAWLAFDKNNGSGSAFRAWVNNWYYLYLDFPEVFILDSFFFYQGDVGIDDIDFMSIELSLDKVTWTQVAYIDSRSVWTRTVTFNPFTAKYARFGAYNDDSGATWGYWRECTLYGYKKSEVPVQTVSTLVESLLKNLTYIQSSPIMSASAQGGYTVTASSEKGTNSAWKAFDGSSSSFWEATANVNEWLKMAFPTAVIINRIKLTAVAPANIQPERWIIQGSNDNTAWVDIKEWIDSEIWVVGESTYFDFENTTAYLFYRLFIRTSQGGATIGIGECSFQTLPDNAVYGTALINLTDTQTVITIADGFTSKGQNDFTLALPLENETVPLQKASYNYIYLRRNPLTGQITYESKQFAPIYGKYQPEYIPDIPVLLRGDNIASISTIVDAYGNKSITTVGTVTVSTINKKFGAGSLLFSSAGSKVKIPRNMGITTARWSIDFWWNPQSLTGTVDLVSTDPSYSFMLSYGRVATKLALYVSSNGTTWNVASASPGLKANFAINTWYYINFVFTGSRYLVFVDGIQDIEVASSSQIFQLSSLNVGSLAAELNTAPGYIDEFRFRPNMANFYSDLIPIIPTEPDTFIKPWFFNISQMKGYEVEENAEVFTSVQMLALGESYVKDGTSYNTVANTYAYNGRKNIQWSEFNFLTDDWITIPHNIGTDLILSSVNLNSKTAAAPYSNQAIIPIEAVGMYSGSATWGGIPMGKIIDRLNLKIRYPLTASADYVAAYGGSALLSNISDGAISVSGTFTRAF